MFVYSNITFIALRLHKHNVNLHIDKTVFEFGKPGTFRNSLGLANL